jgi:hypothetical protein
MLPMGIQIESVAGVGLNDHVRRQVVGSPEPRQAQEAFTPVGAAAGGPPLL